MKNKKISGIERFYSFYQNIYGDRWPSLKSSLLEPKKHVALINPYAGDNYDKSLLSNSELLAGCLEDDQEFPSPTLTDNGLINYYLLDPASVIAARLLDVNPGDKVLDLCSAPGGKGLTIAFETKGASEITLNDLSRDRRARLSKVVKTYLPSEVQDKIKISAHDATRWSLYETDSYDKILLDAPCSSERHLLNNPKYLENWKEKRTIRLAQQQFAMLASALSVVKPKGRVLYCTCSISPRENDEIIDKLEKKRSGKFKVIRPEIKLGEKTAHGTIFLPDRGKMGPLYVSIIEKF